MRDVQLDIYRGLTMIYILCVGHALFWLRNASEPILSVILFVIPIVFFIAGAAISLRKAERGIWATAANRIRRVAVPYYIYAVIMVAIGALATLLLRGTDYFRLMPFDISGYGWREVRDILLFQNIPNCPCAAHIWFIPLYLILSCTFFIQEKLMKVINRHLYALICLLAFLAAQAFTSLLLLRELLCYNVFMVAGFVYYRKIKVWAVASVALIAAGALALYMFALGGSLCPMQGHKFPPDWIYLTYSMMVLCLISLILWRVKLPNNRLIRIWNERGFTIYLYQTIVFWIVLLLHQEGIITLPVSPLRALLDSLLVLVLSTALSFLTDPLERSVLRRLRHS